MKKFTYDENLEDYFSHEKKRSPRKFNPNKDDFIDLKENVDNSNHICEGACDNHYGEVIQVNVYDRRSLKDWGNFWYCKNAIKKDIESGFDVTVI